MNWLDLIILGILAIFTYRGFKRGFVTRILGLAGVVLGIWLGIKHNFEVAKFLNNLGVSAEIAPYIAMFLIFLASILTATYLAKLIKRTSIFFNLTDNIVGATLGLTEGLLIIGTIFIFLNSINIPPEKVRSSSKLYNPVTKATVSIYDFIEKNFGSNVKFKEQIQKTIETIKNENRDTK